MTSRPRETSTPPMTANLTSSGLAPKTATRSSYNGTFFGRIEEIFAPGKTAKGSIDMDLPRSKAPLDLSAAGAKRAVERDSAGTATSESSSSGGLPVTSATTTGGGQSGSRLSKVGTKSTSGRGRKFPSEKQGKEREGKGEVRESFAGGNERRRTCSHAWEKILPKSLPSAAPGSAEYVAVASSLGNRRRLYNVRYFS